MSKPLYELANIIKEYKTTFIAKHHPLKYHQKVLHAIEHCRTAYFGGHIDKCNSCDYTRISYNSCRNRHCPKCQNTNKERWIEAREQDLLPVTYFHVVFTLPHELHTYCLNYPSELYNILFSASKETIETFSNDSKHLGAQTGMISVLHTWGQNLSLHPHIHMIIPGGGITEHGYWKSAKNHGHFLFPVKAMSIVYKNKFMEKLKTFLEKEKLVIDVVLRKKLYNQNWVVYSKQPFIGPKQVIEYLGRYSHKIAISNHRIKNVNNGKVSFSYKDYAHGSVEKLMTLDADEFLRRFCLHILPFGFRKIRHYGILSSRCKPKFRKYQFMQGIIVIKEERRNWKIISKEKLNFDVERCPCCKTGRMLRIMSFDTNPPPEILKIIHHQIKKKQEEKHRR